MKRKTRKKGQTDGLVVCAGISFLPDMLREIDKRRGWMPRSVFVRNAIAKVLYGQKELNHSNEKKKKQKDAGALPKRASSERSRIVVGVGHPQLNVLVNEQQQEILHRDG
jgi:hypothetical protein